MRAELCWRMQLPCGHPAQCVTQGGAAAEPLARPAGGGVAGAVRGHAPWAHRRGRCHAAVRITWLFCLLQQSLSLSMHDYGSAAGMVLAEGQGVVCLGQDADGSQERELQHVRPHRLPHQIHAAPTRRPCLVRLFAKLDLFNQRWAELRFQAPNLSCHTTKTHPFLSPKNSASLLAKIGSTCHIMTPGTSAALY